MDRMNKSEIIFKIISYVIVIFFALISLYPLIYALGASISTNAAYASGKIVLFPFDKNDMTFEVYGILWRNNAFWYSYINTLFYTFFGTVWSIFISATGAYVLSKRKVLFKRQMNFFVVFTMWFSAGMVPAYMNYLSLGVNNRWGIIIAFGVQAYNIILLRNYFEGVPKEIEEAARIDGANEFQVFSKIYLPMSKSALATVTMFYATGRWNGYFWANMLLDRNEQRPLQVFLQNEIQNYKQAIDEMPGIPSFSADSYAYAILICSIIPVLAIYPLIQKYFERGVNMGGVKG